MFDSQLFTLLSSSVDLATSTKFYYISYLRRGTEEEEPPADQKCDEHRIQVSSVCLEYYIVHATQPEYIHISGIQPHP